MGVLARRTHRVLEFQSPSPGLAPNGNTNSTTTATTPAIARNAPAIFSSTALRFASSFSSIAVSTIAGSESGDTVGYTTFKESATACFIESWVFDTITFSAIAESESDEIAGYSFFKESATACFIESWVFDTITFSAIAESESDEIAGYSFFKESATTCFSES